MTEIETPEMCQDVAPMTKAVVPKRARSRQQGQIIVIFAGSMIALMALCAVVVDVAWYWTVSQRMQRAADAAALAGVVWLPGDPSTAYLTAKAEATKNGFTDGQNGVVVTPLQDTDNKRRLKVTITGPVGTFFSRVVGLNSFPGGREAKADYALPVPMGSPENYYGVFGLTRGLTSSTTVMVPQTNPGPSVDSGWMTPNTAPAPTPATWSTTSGGMAAAVQILNDSQSAYATTNGNQQQWQTYGITPPALNANQTLGALQGIEVRLDNIKLSAACGATTNTFTVALSWNDGGGWSNNPASNSNRTANLSASNQTATLGSSSSFATWPGHSWVSGDLDDTKLRVRVTANKACGTSGTRLMIDHLEVRATWATTVTTMVPQTTTTSLADKLLQGPGTACTTGTPNCYEADGANLNPRGFWGTLNTQGAENVNGDAFQPYYDTATGTSAPSCSTVDPGKRACYDGTNYYNYAVEMAPNTTGGSVYVYDPVFCQVTPAKGTGDRWFNGTNDVSTFFELWDMKDTLYDLSDDVLVNSSDSLFRSVGAADATMGGNASGVGDCKYNTDTRFNDGRDYHDRWYLLASGLDGGPNGHVYRIHTTSTDPANTSDQLGTNGENSFAIYTSASGGAPKVYGLGAMQAFTPLTGSGSGTVSSEFYLAQIEKVHAGKTIEIHLWDPGDTKPLNAKMQILIPTSDTTWAATPFTYTAAQGTTNSGRAVCGALTGAGTEVETNVGNTNGTFNGCWLILRAVIPPLYDAPADGWWKIRYNMTGTGTSNDVTTWTVNIIGNPVHLVLP